MHTHCNITATHSISMAELVAECQKSRDRANVALLTPGSVPHGTMQLKTLIYKITLA